MSETTYPPAPPPAPGVRPPLRRSRTDRKVAGVCGGLAAHLGIDPIILRVLVVVLSIFGGSGILLYAAGWLLIPDEGQERSEVQRLVDRNSTTGPTVVAIVAAGLALLALATLLGLAAAFGGHWWLGGGPDVWPLLIVAAIVGAVWWARRTPSAPPGSPAGPGATPVAAASGQPPSQQPAQTTPPVPAPWVASATAGGSTAAGATYYAEAGQAGGPPVPPSGDAPTMVLPVPPPPPPRPRRERSALAPVTLSLLLVAAGVMVLLDRADVWHLRAVPFLAVLVGIVGLALIVGSVLGRGRGLIWVGVLLTLVTAVAAAVPGASSGRTGHVRWAPTTLAAVPAGGYTWSAGRVDLDLTALPVSGVQEVQLQVGAGDVTIDVPTDVTLVITSHVGIGSTRLPNGVRADGFSRDTNVTYAPTAGPARGTIDLRVDLGAGQLEVRHA